MKRESWCITFFDVELWAGEDAWDFVTYYLREADARRLVRRMPSDVPLRIVRRSGDYPVPKKLVIYERRRRDWGNWHEPRTYDPEEAETVRGLPSDECHCDRPLPARKKEP